MGKKDKISQNDENKRIKQLKSRKTQNKQMFTQLRTHQQNKINKLTQRDMQLKLNQSQMMDQQDSNSYSKQIQLKNPNNKQDIEKVCSIVQNLMIKNKINAKNAFQVPFIDLQKLEDFQKINQSENGWKKISSTLENDSKIYAYRVDAIHSIAYKIMNTMSRNQENEGKTNQEQNKNKNKNEIELSQLSIPVMDQFDVPLGAQLQKNIQNINMQSIDRQCDFNTTYQRTRRKFDQCSLKGILLNNIQLDNNLQLSINQMRKQKPNGFFFKPIPVKVDQLKQKLLIFKQTQQMRRNVKETLKQQFVPSTNLQKAWKQVMIGNFEYQKSQDNEVICIDDPSQMVEQNVMKKVQDVIKLKKKKTSLRSMKQVAEDGIGWLSQKDKQMLGMQNTASNMNMKKINYPSEKPIQNQDDIQFKLSSQLAKGDVFTQQTKQKQKNQYKQQIQQKHLLPLRLFYKFKVQQILTLRYEPPQIALNNEIGVAQQIQIERQIEQIDVKRQQISIKQSKQKIKGIIGKQSTFYSVYKKFQALDKNISPQLCFLTMLHVANQNNLKLQQINQSNFKIKF